MIPERLAEINHLAVCNSTSVACASSCMLELVEEVERLQKAVAFERAGWNRSQDAYERMRFDRDKLRAQLDASLTGNGYLEFRRVPPEQVRLLETDGHNNPS